MDYYLLWKVVIVVTLMDIMDMCSFYRKRNVGYACIKQFGMFKRDLWHDSKKVLLFFVFGELVKWDILLLIMAGFINVIIHEAILYKGWFKTFINNRE